MRFNTLRTVRLTTATLLGLLPLSVSVATAEVKNLKARAVSSDCIRLQWTGAAVGREDEDAMLDPSTLLLVLAALAKMTGGVAIDPQSGSVITDE